MVDGTRGTYVEQIGGGVEGFDPEGGRHVRLEKNSAENVVGGTDRAFGLAILGGSVRAREAEGNAAVGEEGA